MSFDNLDFAIDNEVSGSFTTVIDLLGKVDDKIEKLAAEVSQQGLSMASVSQKLFVIEASCASLMKRTGSRQPCLFCSKEQNKDGHISGRCHQYPDVIIRALRVAELSLCRQSLKDRHEHACAVRCVLLCPNRNGPAPRGPPALIKRRKF
ncbi:hypothetical protein Y032_0025g1173 [Ancylostoma ceylanicum]|uniref:Uncharacterized protein n=1 Tax=Ancylostoma ceylanicum TaxID=53326 RepID=A0A016UVT4_9BILA|nr:hypothetical protein Y032_0025g1173 [Ancylostoma ceylanicum]